jgi:hypothetical protein
MQIGCQFYKTLILLYINPLFTQKPAPGTTLPAGLTTLTASFAAPGNLVAADQLR